MSGGFHDGGPLPLAESLEPKAEMDIQRLTRYDFLWRVSERVWVFHAQAEGTDAFIDNRVYASLFICFSYRKI